MGEIAKLQVLAREYAKEKVAAVEENLELLHQKNFFRYLQYALMALVVCQNAHRPSSVLSLKPEYFSEVFFDNQFNMVGIKQAPQKLDDLRGIGLGRSQFVKMVQDTLNGSSKVFYKYGVVHSVLTKEDFDLFPAYIQIRKEMGFKDISYLFAPDVENEDNWDAMYGKMKNWSTPLPKELGMKISSTDLRKVITNYIAQNATDPQALEAVDRHLGHSAVTSRLHYRGKVQKMKDAMLSASLINEAYKREIGDSQQALKSNPAKALEPIAEEEAEEEAEEASCSNVPLVLGQNVKLINEIAIFLESQERQTGGRRSAVPRSDYCFIGRLYCLKKRKGVNLRATVRDFKKDLPQELFNTYYEAVRAKLTQVEKKFGK